MNKKEEMNLERKYQRFKRYAPFFYFNPNITKAEDIDKYYNKEISVTHKECGRTMNVKLSKWLSFHSRGKDVPKDEYQYLCDFCSREYMKSSLQDFLDKKYNKDFIVTGEYIGSKEPIEIYHKSCNGYFSKTPEVIYRDRLICKECRKSDYIYEENKRLENNLYFEIELKKAGFNNFKLADDFISKSKPVKVYHSKCGGYFYKPLNQILKLKNKDLCPSCKENRFKSDNQKEKNKYFQDKLNSLYGEKYKLLSDYNGSTNLVELEHNKCGNKFKEYAQTVLINYKCPYCENERIKRNSHITLKEKINIYEKELNYEYKILTPFTRESDFIDILHKECGTKFNRLVSALNRERDGILCPECNKMDKYMKKLERLDLEYNNQYEVVSDPVFRNTDEINILHKKCNHHFTSNFKILFLNHTEHCPNCNDRITSTDKLKSVVFQKYKGEYLVVGEYTKANYKIPFRHKKCGRITKLTAKEFLRYKTPCKCCRNKKRSFSFEEAQNKVNEKFGKLFTLHGEYTNSETEMPIKCNNCNNIFESSLSTLLKKSRCPNCKTKKL